MTEITFDSLYHELPEIDKENLEFLLDIFSEAVEQCRAESQDLSLYNVFKSTQLILLGLPYEERRKHHQLLLSVSEPGLEVMRWFPKIADRLEIKYSLEPLDEYVNPSPMMAMNIYAWNRASTIISSNPELADKLRKKEKKPEMFLLDFGDERGLVAGIVSDDEQIVVKNILGDEEAAIAQIVAGEVGPNIISMSDSWIIEELIDGLSLDDVRHHSELVGAAIGVALRKTHALNIAYLDRFDRRHVQIDRKTKKVRMIDWSSAEINGNKEQDLRNAVSFLKAWYCEHEEQMTALKSLKTAYCN